jgi:hypothetical protein
LLEENRKARHEDHAAKSTRKKLDPRFTDMERQQKRIKITIEDVARVFHSLRKKRGLTAESGERLTLNIVMSHLRTVEGKLAA